ncbi:MAG: type II toxin-antitoxin system Phd/YefM family antitoxin [Sporichthyaceae bacterium]
MAITASEARKRLFPLIQEVNDDAVAVEITSKNGNAVLVSADEWNSIQETLYLMRSPANAARLRESLAQVRRGEFTARELVDPDAQ